MLSFLFFFHIKLRVEVKKLQAKNLKALRFLKLIMKQYYRGNNQLVILKTMTKLICVKDAIEHSISLRNI